MATYCYQCKNCEHRFETEHSMKQDPLSRCPKCEKDELERLIVATSFVLHGNGWAKDNYSSSGEKKIKNE